MQITACMVSVSGARCTLLIQDSGEGGGNGMGLIGEDVGMLSINFRRSNNKFALELVVPILLSIVIVPELPIFFVFLIP